MNWKRWKMAVTAPARNLANKIYWRRHQLKRNPAKESHQPVNHSSLSNEELGEEIITLGGMSYLTYLADLVHAKKAKSYLEVGTNFGSSLAPISCASIAVDPTFRLNMDVVGKKKICLLYQMTSDDFFAEYKPNQIMGRAIDTAFLDGMHLYEFLLRDIINTEKCCHRESLIVLHDCMPPTFEMTNREFKPAMINKKYTNYWTGDVWKILPILERYRPDIRITYIDCPPSGLAVLTNLNPDSRVLDDNYQHIIEEYKDSPGDKQKLKLHLQGLSLVPSLSTSPAELLGRLYV